MERELAAIVLAAGLGSRMRSKRAKVLHELGGEPLIVRALRAVSGVLPSILAVVVGHQAAEVEAAVRPAFAKLRLAFAVQAEQRGTGDAARCGLGAIPVEFSGDVLISYGDLPMISPDTLAEFVKAHRRHESKLSLITVKLPGGRAYGRVLRNRDGSARAIIEARDASPDELAVNEINTGVYLVDAALLRRLLAEISPDNAQREYYLTDIVAMAARHGTSVLGWCAENPAEFAGINSREELAQMEAEIRSRVNQELMAAGVTMIDPASVYISAQTQVGPDTIIGPNVQMVGRCRIGRGVRIEGTAWLSNVTIGDRCHLKIGVRAEDCTIGEESEIGPFANLRSGTELEGHNRIGNFVETKKARLGRGTKASHLSYLGDVTIGRETNVGCGVITVNYDGYQKHETRIGDRCMVGCDTQLIAPVTVGNDVYVASGTTIIREVPAGSLVMSQHPQREKAGWVASWRKRHDDSTPVDDEAPAQRSRSANSKHE